MKIRIKISLTAFSFAMLSIFLFQCGRKNEAEKAVVKSDDTRESEWDSIFTEVEIPSSADSSVQMAYFFRSRGDSLRPLIVSLHTWSGDYTQEDELAEYCHSNNVNYIHPDFRGPNRSLQACCSELAISDIDDAIDYAIQNSRTDTSAVYVIGVSGGGYATLSTFMNSDKKIKKFSAWASISDLIAWYYQSLARENKYAGDILNCTGSGEKQLNVPEAMKRSPFYHETPADKLSDSELCIYAGIYDGIRGSVPFTQSIKFYNKILSDLSVKDSSKYVSQRQILELLEYRKPVENFGSISDREICLEKKYKNLRLIIFEGDHEMLTEFAFNDLLKNIP